MPTNEWLKSPPHKKRLDDRATTSAGFGTAKSADGRQFTVGLYHPATPDRPRG